MPDRIEETLSTLRVDVDRASLADPGSVRRRGDQRTRQQAVAAAVAVVAVVAVVAGVAGLTGGLVGADRSVGPPATEGPSVSTTPDSGPPTMDPPVTEVPDSVLLTGDDVGLGPLAQANVKAAGIETLTGGCLLGSDDLVDFGFAAFGPDPDGKPTVSQSVISQATAADSARQLAGFRADLDACEERVAQQPNPHATTVTPASPSPIAAWELTLGDGGWAYQITTPDFTSLVVGFRTANASAVLAFETDQFSFEEALKLADLARQRMTEVFGA